MLRASLRLSLLIVLASLSIACAARPVDDEAGTTTMVGGDGSDTASSTEGTSAMTTATTFTTSTDTETGDGDGDPGDGDGDGECSEPIKLDLASDTEPSMPDSCTLATIPWPAPDEYPGCTLCQDRGGCWHQAYLGCVTPEPGQTCAELCPSGDCLGAYWNSCDGDMIEGWSEVPDDLCGPYEIDGQCCSVGKFLYVCAE